MNESKFGFEYSWSDLQPVRGLSVIVLSAQVCGALAGLLFPRFPHWFESMWYGGALVTFPAFLLGLAAQARLKPGSLGKNKIMVLRMGFISAILGAFALAMPLLAFGQHVV